MTYREIVLKLLQTREDLVCVEKHLMSDFSDHKDYDENFSKWCLAHGIDFIKLQQEEPAKVYLKKNTVTSLTDS
jgi:hypothetical protein